MMNLRCIQTQIRVCGISERGTDPGRVRSREGGSREGQVQGGRIQGGTGPGREDPGRDRSRERQVQGGTDPGRVRSREGKLQGAKAGG